MKQNKGFVLLMTLGIMLIMSMLVLASMQHVLLYYKVLNRQELEHRQFYQLEHMAGQLTHHFVPENQCLVHQASVNEVLHQLKVQKGCILVEKESRYRYVINDLGTFPCLVLRTNEEEHATHHYSISLLAENRGHTLMLQLRLIQLGPVMQCEGEKHFLSLGVGSWRYFRED